MLFRSPGVTDLPLLVYRTDIFDEAPTTWDDIAAVGDQLDGTAADDAWVFRGASGNPVVTAWFATLYGTGGKMFNDDWTVAFNSDEGVAALEQHIELLKYSPNGIPEFDSDQEGAAILNGTAAAANLWGGWVLAALDPEQSEVSDKVAFGAPPGTVTQATLTGVQVFAVSAASKNPEEAQAFVEWFTSEPIQIEYARLGGQPVRESAFADAEANEAVPYLSGMLAALEVAVPRPRTTEWAEIEDVLGIKLNLALVEADPAKARTFLDKAAEQATEILTRAGYFD